jgi:hypothetical protein
MGVYADLTLESDGNYINAKSRKRNLPKAFVRKVFHAGGRISSSLILTP